LFFFETLYPAKSIFVDPFGSYIYVHSNSHIHRISLRNEAHPFESLSCINENSIPGSNGMYVSYNGRVTVAHREEDSSVILYDTYIPSCNYDIASVVLEQNNMVEYTAIEGCFVVTPLPPIIPPLPPTNPPFPDTPPGAPPGAVPPPGVPPFAPPGFESTADTIQQTQNIPLYSSWSTGVVGIVGATSVGFMALFGIVLAINNIKKNPAAPDMGILVDPESNAVVFTNPLGHDGVGVANNVLA